MKIEKLGVFYKSNNVSSALKDKLNELIDTINGQDKEIADLMLQVYKEHHKKIDFIMENTNKKLAGYYDKDETDPKKCFKTLKQLYKK